MQHIHAGAHVCGSCWARGAGCRFCSSKRRRHRWLGPATPRSLDGWLAWSSAVAAAQPAAQISTAAVCLALAAAALTDVLPQPPAADVLQLSEGTVKQALHSAAATCERLQPPALFFGSTTWSPDFSAAINLQLSSSPSPCREPR